VKGLGSKTRLGSITEALITWYEAHGRAHLPWRTEQTPYAVVVSEFMLQQTQVDRVLPLFLAFLERFPDFAALAAAERSEVVRYWKGLGYNSRAVRLHELARRVVELHHHEMPRNHEQLRALPGVGPYTHAAILAFAFNEPAIAFDTNIRRVVHRLFWGIEHPYKVEEAAIEAKSAEMLPLGIAREWNAAMMDLGATICTARAPKCLICPLQKFCVASPIDGAQLADLAKKNAKPPRGQAKLKFEETTRYARGRIIDHLRALPAKERISLLDLHTDLKPQLGTRDEAVIDRIVADLVRDGLVESDLTGVRLHG
jgi:A/G-specific adenine glycosylase